MSLPLRNLFVYPIERHIPPVARVNDTATDTIERDLREYVVTGPIEQALVEFLDVYAASRTEATDKIGVWISGFFGSGKSHFAKILSYLLTNPTVGEETARDLFLTRVAGSPRRSELEGLLHRIGLLDNRVTMFQIKAEQDQSRKDESISEIMYRRYLAGRGLSTDPVVASLELSLIERGLYDDFRREVEARMGTPWEVERDDALFVQNTVADALRAVAPDAYRNREEALAALEMVERSQTLTVVELAQRLAAYVDELAAQGDPERPPRLVYIMDEIGQFIGTDGQKLLELQSIAEEFANQDGKLWLVVTAQAKLHELIAGVKAVEADFGKIGDRFDTRLTLTSEDIEKVLEGRILQKKDRYVPQIRDFYFDHEGTLAMLSDLPGASRDLPPVTAETFTAQTPFLPYHTGLIQDVFASVKAATATGFSFNPEARSMIGMAQGVLSNPDNGFVNGDLGRVVSLDMVYDRIAVDLQPQDRQEINSIPERLPGYRALDQRVVKALYLLQHVRWIAVTAETLAHTLLRDVEGEKLATLQAEVEESLERLQKARYVIAKEDGVWEFLTGTKKSFEEEVAGVNVRQADLRREARKALAEVLRPVGKLNYKSGVRTFDVVVRGDGEELQSGRDMVLEVFSPLWVEIEDRFDSEDLEQVESFAHPETVYWVADENEELRSLLTRWVKLDTVLDQWQAKRSKTDEEREIIREKMTELSAVRGKIETVLRKSLYNGTIIWNGRAEPLDGRTTTLNPIFNRHMARVVPHVYPKFHIAEVKPNESDVEAVLTLSSNTLATVAPDLDLFDRDGHLNQHSAVVQEVREEMERRANRGYELSGKALEEHFAGGDYGWHPTIVRLILAAMFRGGLVSVKADNVHYTSYSVPAAQMQFTKTRPFRRAVFYYEGDVAVAPAELRQAQDDLKLIFDVSPREETANVVGEQIESALDDWGERAQRVIYQLRPAGYPLPEPLLSGGRLTERITRFPNPSKIVKAFLDHREEVDAWQETVETLRQFLSQRRLLIFQQAQVLLRELDRAQGTPGLEALTEADDAQQWRATLRTLIDEGQVADRWDRFHAAYVPLRQRYRQVYEEAHRRRDRAVQAGLEELNEMGAPTQRLRVYECQELHWSDEAANCDGCQASLRELDSQRVAVRAETRAIKEEFLAAQRYDSDGEGKRVRYVKVAEMIGKRRLESEEDLESALGTLRQYVMEALHEADAVELE